MAHPYSTQPRLEALLGSDLVLALLDRNHDGTADDGVYDGTLERACNRIDSRVGGLYVVPFAGVGDTPTPTPGTISDIADYITAQMLFSVDNPDSADAKYWGGQADAELAKVLSGAYVLNATKQDADATAAAGLKVLDHENSYGLDDQGCDNLDRY